MPPFLLANSEQQSQISFAFLDDLLRLLFFDKRQKESFQRLYPTLNLIAF